MSNPRHPTSSSKADHRRSKKRDDHDDVHRRHGKKKAKDNDPKDKPKETEHEIPKTFLTGRQNAPTLAAPDLSSQFASSNDDSQTIESISTQTGEFLNLFRNKDCTQPPRSGHIRDLREQANENLKAQEKAIENMDKAEAPVGTQAIEERDEDAEDDEDEDEGREEEDDKESSSTEKEPKGNERKKNREGHSTRGRSHHREGHDDSYSQTSEDSDRGIRTNYGGRRPRSRDPKRSRLHEGKSVENDTSSDFPETFSHFAASAWREQGGENDAKDSHMGDGEDTVGSVYASKTAGDYENENEDEKEGSGEYEGQKDDFEGSRRRRKGRKKKRKKSKSHGHHHENDDSRDDSRSSADEDNKSRTSERHSRERTHEKDDTKHAKSRRSPGRRKRDKGDFFPDRVPHETVSPEDEYHERVNKEGGDPSSSPHHPREGRNGTASRASWSSPPPHMPSATNHPYPMSRQEYEPKMLVRKHDLINQMTTNPDLANTLGKHTIDRLNAAKWDYEELKELYDLAMEQVRYNRDLPHYREWGKIFGGHFVESASQKFTNRLTGWRERFGEAADRGDYDTLFKTVGHPVKGYADKHPAKFCMLTFVMSLASFAYHNDGSKSNKETYKEFKQYDENLPRANTGRGKSGKQQQSENEDDDVPPHPSSGRPESDPGRASPLSNRGGSGDMEWGSLLNEEDNNRKQSLPSAADMGMKGHSNNSGSASAVAPSAPPADNTYSQNRSPPDASHHNSPTREKEDTVTVRDMLEQQANTTQQQMQQFQESIGEQINKVVRSLSAENSEQMKKLSHRVGSNEERQDTLERMVQDLQRNQETTREQVMDQITHLFSQIQMASQSEFTSTVNQHTNGVAASSVPSFTQAAPPPPPPHHHQQTHEDRSTSSSESDDYSGPDQDASEFASSASREQSSYRESRHMSVEDAEREWSREPHTFRASTGIDQDEDKESISHQQHQEEYQNQLFSSTVTSSSSTTINSTPASVPPPPQDSYNVSHSPPATRENQPPSYSAEVSMAPPSSSSRSTTVPIMDDMPQLSPEVQQSIDSRRSQASQENNRHAQRTHTTEGGSQSAGEGNGSQGSPGNRSRSTKQSASHSRRRRKGGGMQYR